MMVKVEPLVRLRAEGQKAQATQELDRPSKGGAGHMILAGTIVVGGEKRGYFTPDGRPIEGLGKSGYGHTQPLIDMGELAAADEAPGAED
jgi:hypothetical protein